MATQYLVTWLPGWWKRRHAEATSQFISLHFNFKIEMRPKKEFNSCILHHNHLLQYGSCTPDFPAMFSLESRNNKRLFEPRIRFTAQFISLHFTFTIEMRPKKEFSSCILHHNHLLQYGSRTPEFPAMFSVGSWNNNTLIRTPNTVYSTNCL